MTQPPVSRAGLAATFAAVLAIIAGLVTLGKPSHARERRLDELRVGDLSRLSDAVDVYWTRHAILPPTLDSLVSQNQLERVPVDPQSNSAYTYLASGERSYRLCATFAQPSDTTLPLGYAEGIGVTKHSWRHGAGESCFDLTAPQKDAK
jgi:hypothetical protein